MQEQQDRQFVPQAYGIAPNQIPQGVPPPPGYEIPQAVQNLIHPNQPGSPATPASPPPTPYQAPPPQQNQQGPPPVMQLPNPRNNPKNYVLLQGTYYKVLNLDLSNRIEFARAQNQPVVDIGHGKQVNIRFMPHPSLPGVMQNETRDLQEYFPQWFFLDNSQRWSPMSPNMNFQLTSAKNRGESEARDAERTYDLNSYNQINRQSRRKRPLLFLRDDGSAVRGECMAMWAYQGTFRGAPATVTVPFNVAEQLDTAVMRGYPTANVQFQPAGSPGPANIQVKINPGRDEHEGEVVGDPYRKYKMIRFFPTWFFMDNDMHWSSLDFNSTVQLDAACAHGYFTSNDREREYDLIRLLQINLQSKKVRPLIQVRGHAGAIPASFMQSDTGRGPQMQQAFGGGGRDGARDMGFGGGGRDAAAGGAGPFDAVVDRSNIVLKQLFGGDVASNITNTSNSPAKRVLYFLNALVHEFKFVVKGPIVRDAVVKDDVSNSDTIDVEIPGGFTAQNWRQWVDSFLSRLESGYQVKRDPSAGVSSRAANDLFGQGGGRFQRGGEDGVITIPIILPGDLKMKLECIAPWNTADAPPRNVDLSVNNLRITEGATEISLSVPLPYGNDFSNRFTVIQTMKQILDSEATPSYDYKWVDGTPGRTGEGFNGNKWVIGHNDNNQFRAQNMNALFEKMRSKGYKFVEGPR